MPMERTTKVILGIIIFGAIVPTAIILPLTSRQEHEAQHIAGIRDYKAGRYDLAIRELDVYLKSHPLVLRKHMGLMADTPDYAEKYLGFALMKQKRYAEAADAFRIYAHCSDAETGNYLLGNALLKAGKNTEAKKAFQQVIEEQQQNASSRKSYHLSDLSRDKIKEIDQLNGKQ